MRKFFTFYQVIFLLIVGYGVFGMKTNQLEAMVGPNALVPIDDIIDDGGGDQVLAKNGEVSNNAYMANYGIGIDVVDYRITVFDEINFSHSYNGRVIGTAQINIFRARLREKVFNDYVDKLLIVIQMQPREGVKGNGSKYYHGLNNYAGIEFQLKNNQHNISHAPMSLPPVGQNNWTYGLGFNDETVTYSVSLSTVTTVNAIELVSSYDGIDKTYKIGFDYQPISGNDSDGFGINNWLNTTHMVLLGIDFRTPVKYTNFFLTYEIEFAVAENYSEIYDGEKNLEFLPTLSKRIEHIFRYGQS